jgi:hypothetical protein
LREVLVWCSPALVVAIAMRIAMAQAMPFAYFHDDTPDFISTPDILIHQHRWELHEKKTFLVPILFALPFALPIPALVSIPFFQEILGLGLIVLIGALCRLWFTHWKLFILPLTLLAAINPFYLWYERTLIAETTFVFCTALVAVAGTLYAKRQSIGRFVFLCVALVLEAGARPEGKLLFGFGVFFVVLIHWSDLRNSWRRPALVAFIGLLTHFITRTEQAGLLLYTSVARLTPPQLAAAPGFEPYIAPIREDLQKRWDDRPQFPRVRDRKAINDVISKYLKDGAAQRGEKKNRGGVNAMSFKLARETCLKNLSQLPGLALIKFRLASNDSPAGRFDNNVLFEKQREAFTDNVPRTARLSRGLTGQFLPDEAAMNAFIDRSYGEVPWFNALTEKWLNVVNAIRLPDAAYPNPEHPGLQIILYGVPLYFIVAAVGMFVAMFLPGQLRAFHIAWGLALFGYFFVIMLTANVRPRFRFVFEPFWFLYIGLVLQAVILGVKRIANR